MADKPRNRGPWTHRALVWSFSFALGLLAYWLLGFVVNDIASWPGPEYAKLEETQLDPALLKEERAIQAEREEITRQVEHREGRQSLLRDSATSSKQTMDQLLSIRRLGLEKSIEPTEAEQKALADAEQLFLENQKAYQTLSQEIGEFQEQLRTLATRERELNTRLEVAREPIRAEYERQWQWHQWRLAGAKLAVLLPLIVAVAWAFLRWRHGLYAPLIYALGIALALKVTVVMHDHFPARYFKYILIMVALAIVTRILVYLLQMIGRPGRAYLLRQYREAYERFFCPVCDFPIRRGPMKYVFWSRSTIKKLRFPPQVAEQADEPYTCPDCGTSLFEKCSQCGQIRHSLLPVCQHCGHEKAAD